MKGIVAFDDVDIAAGRRVLADTHVVISLNGLTGELDLTQEHAAELADMLRPWLEAGGAFGHASPAGVVRDERRGYLKEFRKWADLHGVKYLTPGGSYRYRDEDLARFNHWLASSGREITSGQA